MSDMFYPVEEDEIESITVVTKAGTTIKIVVDEITGDQMSWLETEIAKLSGQFWSCFVRRSISEVGSSKPR
jgi:hypothetical protein